MKKRTSLLVAAAITSSISAHASVKPNIEEYADRNNYENPPSYYDYRAFDTPVNYNYGYFGIGTGSVDSDLSGLGNEDYSVSPLDIALGFSGMLSKKWLYEIKLYGNSIDEDLENDLDYSYTSASLDMSIGYRFVVTDESDIVLDVKAGWSQYDAEYRSIKTDDSSVITGAGLALKQGWGNHWESTLLVDTNYRFNEFSSAVGSELAFYFTKNVGLAGYYYYNVSDNDQGSHYGAQIRVNFR